MANNIDFVIRTVWQSTGIGGIINEQRNLQKSLKDTDKATRALASAARPAKNMMHDYARTTTALNKHTQSLQKTVSVYEQAGAAMRNSSTDLARLRNGLGGMQNAFNQSARATEQMGRSWTLATTASKSYQQSLNTVIAAMQRVQRSDNAIAKIAADTQKLTKVNDEMARSWNRLITAGAQSRMKLSLKEVVNDNRTAIKALTNDLNTYSTALSRLQTEAFQKQEARQVAEIKKTDAFQAGDNDAVVRYAEAIDRLNAELAQNETAQQETARAIDTTSQALREAQQLYTLSSTAVQNLSDMIQRNNRVIQLMATAWQALGRVMQTVRNTAASIAMTIGNVLSGALNTAGRAVGSLSNMLGRLGAGAGSGFARLRAALDGTGKAFLGFGRTVESSLSSAQRRLNDFLSAGWSLLGSGAMIRNYGRVGMGALEGAMSTYMDTEQQLLRAGIAGETWFDAGTGAATGVPRGNIAGLGQVILNLQSGRDSSGQRVAPGTGPTPLSIFSAQELSEQLYTLTSALGLPLDARNTPMAGAMLSPLASLAAYTQTDPETVIKGISNMMLQFGMDPRDTLREGAELGLSGKAAQDFIANSDLGKVAGQVGLLANISTMEISDIIETFKMMGPQVNQLYGAEPGAGLTDAMVTAFIASEAGMRGSQVGRGVSMLMSSLLDPQAPMVEALQEVFGADATFEDVFFSGDGTLKNGLRGVFQTIAESGASQQEMAKLVSTLFTQNVSRTVGGISGQLFGENYMSEMGKWDETFALLEERPEQFLAEATLAMEGTLTAAFAHVGSAWEQVQISIVEGVKGPLIEALRSFGEVLFDIAYALRNNPALAEFIGKLIAFGSIAITVTGSLMVLAGALLLAARAFHMMGGTAAAALRFFAVIPHLIAGAIVPILLLATTIAALKLAWDSNLFGMQDAWNSFRENLSAESVMANLESVTMWIKRIGAAFSELIFGIFLGVGNTNNLGALLDTIFGVKSGSMIYGWLIQFGNALDDTRERIAGFFEGVGDGSLSIMTFVDAFRQLVEAVLFGGQAITGEFSGALNDVLEIFGGGMTTPEQFEFFERIHEGFLLAVNIIRSFGAEVRTELEDIWQNIQRIAEGFGGFGELLANFAGGVFVGFLNAIVRFLDLLDAITSRLAGTSEAFQRWADSTEGARERMAQFAQVLGALIGTWLGARLIAAITPGITLMAQFTLMLAQGAVAVTIFAARIALAVVQLALFTAATVVSAFASFLAFLITTPLAFLALAVAIAIATDAMGEVEISVEGIIEAVTRAVEVLIELGTGFVSAFMLAFDVISSVVGVIQSFLGALDSAGIINFTSAVEALGFAIGGVLIASMVGGIPGIRAFGSALLSVFGIIGNFAKNNPLTATRVAGGLGLAGLSQMLEEPLQGLIEDLGVATDSANELANAITNIGTAAAIGFAVGGPWGAAAGAGAAGIWELYQYVSAAPELNPPGSEILSSNVIDDYRGLITASSYAGDNYGQFMGTSAGLREAIAAEVMRSVSLPAPGGVLTTPSNYPVSPYLNQEFAGEFSADIADAFPELGLTPQTIQTWITGSLATTMESGLSSRAALYVENAEGQIYVDKNGNPVIPSITPGSSGNIPGLGTFASPTGVYGPPTIADLNRQALALQAGYITTELPRGGVGQEPKGIWDQIKDSFNNRSLPEFTDVMKNAAKALGMDIENGQWMPDPKMVASVIQDDFSEFSSIFGDNAGMLIEAMASGDTQEVMEIMAETNQQRVAAEEEYQAAVVESFNSMLDGLADMDMVDAAKMAFDELSMGIQATMAGGLVAGYAGDRPRGYVSAGAAVMTHADTIMGNLVDSEGESVAPWMNQVELLMDLAVAGGAGTNVGGGVNMHTALAGPLSTLAQQTGLGIEQILNDVPKFFADQRYVPAAAAMLADGLSQVTNQGTREAIDLFGQAEGLNEFGLEWVDVVDYAIANAASGEQWDFVDFVVDSYGLSVEEAEGLMAQYSIDPTVISSGLFADLQTAIADEEGYTVFSADMLATYQEMLDRGTDGVIEITQTELDNMSLAMKHALDQQGMIFTITPEVKAGPTKGVDELEDSVRKSLPAGGLNVAVDVVVTPKITSDGSKPDGSGAPRTAQGAISGPTKWDLPPVTANLPIIPMPVLVDDADLTLPDIPKPKGPTKPVTVDIPFVANYVGAGAMGFPMGLDTGGAGLPDGPTTITVTADTSQALGAITALSSSLSALSLVTWTATVDIQAADGALEWYNDQFISKLNGMAAADFTATVNIAAGMAPQTLQLLMDKLTWIGMFNGAASVSVSDNASGILDALIGKLMWVGMFSGTADVFVSVSGEEALYGVYNTLLAMPSSKTTSLYVNTYSTNFVSTVSAGGGMFFAEGGLVTSKWQVVGEQGPELVQLPYGSFVYDADKTGRMMNPVTSQSFARQNINTSGASGGGDKTVNIGTIVVNDRADADYLIGRIDRELGVKMDREVNAVRKSTYRRSY